MNSLAFVVALCAAILTGPAFAGGEQSFSRYAADEPLDGDQAFQTSMMTGRDGTVLMRWEMPSGYLLYRNKIKFIPTGGIAIRDVRAPAGEMKRDPIMGLVEIYRDSVTIAVRRTNPAQAGTLTVKYQGCVEDTLCYPPMTRSFSVPAVCAASKSHKNGGKTC